MFKKLSPKQHAILNFIHQFINERGYPPTIRDIVNGCGLSSTSVVEYNLKILEREGYLHRDREVSRGLGLLKGRHSRSVPLVGHIAAGAPLPIPGEESWHPLPWENIEIPEELVSGEKTVYALKVKGQSMLDALIDDGDIILLRPSNTAEEGEMVAVWLKEEKEVTLKRFYHQGDKIRLQPANNQIPPLYVKPQNIEIQGKVVAILRRL